VFHALERSLGDSGEVIAVLEKPPARWDLARRRARRLGWFTVAGHMMFVGLIMPVLRLTGRARVGAIAIEHGFDLAPIDDAVLVRSVNDEQTLEVLRRADPCLVVVHGTRIISDRLLGQIGVPVVNLHAGITPRYRGVHGGYWAFFDERPDLAGTTVHLVDSGIDTGGILRQETFEPNATDTVATYPFLHVACGLPPLLETAGAVAAGGTPVIRPMLPGAEASQLRWHPTAWGYLAARIRRGVR